MSRLNTLLLAGLLLVCLAVFARFPGQTPAFGQTGEEPIAAAPSGPRAIPETNLLEVIQKGGVLMYPILGCSVVMFIFVFERAISLRRSHILPGPFKRFLLQLREGQLEQEDALKRCAENNSPVAQVFGAAASKWGRSPVEVEQAMIDAGEREANKLKKNLRVLNAISTITPLLGLLGTVFGMIEAFNDIAASGGQAMGRPEMIASGISQALLTTAGGLTVAIPALCFYLYFASCVDRRISEMDELGHEVVQLICGEARIKKKAA
jgi:biopolymer transport protein ExbB